MTTIVRRRALGITSVKGIIAASNSELSYANNYQGIPHDDVYIRWGCTSQLPNAGATVINNPSAIHRVSDKRGFRKQLSDAGLCQMTYTSINQIPNEPNMVPMVVRKKTHAQGRHLWLCRTLTDLRHRCAQLGEGNYYFSAFIDKVAEYRVFVQQGYVVWVAEKTPGDRTKVAWNVNRGGRFDNVRWDNWDMVVNDCAIRSWELSGLHFGGVDVMVDEGGEAYCLEINSAPSQTSPYRQECVAKAFDWMIEQEEYGIGLTRGPAPVVPSSWKKQVHPGVWERGRNAEEARNV